VDCRWAWGVGGCRALNNYLARRVLNSKTRLYYKNIVTNNIIFVEKIYMLQKTFKNGGKKE